MTEKYVVRCDWPLRDDPFPKYVHRAWGRAHSLTIEGHPMVYRNRSVARKVRQKANREVCAGKAIEERYDPDRHYFSVEDEFPESIN